MREKKKKKYDSKRFEMPNLANYWKMSIVYISQQAKIPRYKSPFSGAGQK